MANPQDYQLRPIQESDLELVLQWRNSERVRSNMYTDHIISLNEHKEWFFNTRYNQSMLHQICECNQQPIGVSNFTNIDKKNKKCYWGFYLGDTNLMIGNGSIMGFMALQYAFEILDIRKLCSEVFKFNSSSIKLHNKLGFYQEGCFAKHIYKSGQYEDVVALALFEEQWLGLKDDLYKLVFRSS